MLLALLLCCGAASSPDGALPGDGGGTGGSDGGGGDGGGTGGSDGGGGDGDGGGTSGDGGGGTAGDGGSSGGDCATLSWRTEERVFIDTQAELSTFCAKWNAVEGDLVVDVGGELDPITQLDGIGCLCQVQGDLVITGDSSLEDGGLEDSALEDSAPTPPHVTGDVELYALQRVGGDLRLTHHPNLSSVEGLGALTEVGGDLVLQGNPSQQVASFYALERVGGSVVVRDMEKLLLLRLPVVQALGGLEVGTEGDAGSAPYLVQVQLTALQEVEGDLRLVGLGNLDALEAPTLTTVGGALHLAESCELVPELDALDAVGSLTLSALCAVTDLSGLPALRRLTGQDATGHSLRVEATEHLDAAELDALLDQLELLGTGAIDIENAGTCAEAMADYGTGWCD